MPSQANITTRFPAGIKRDAVIATLHDHDIYIRTTCPDVIEFHKISGTPAVGSSCVYEVTDKRPIGKTTFQLTLVNHHDGVTATVNGKAPTGSILVVSKWLVHADRIEEVVSIDSNFVMNKMIKGNVEKSHPQQHLGFCQAAQA
ncbi:unnamed protein product [Discula destructiva]